MYRRNLSGDENKLQYLRDARLSGGNPYVVKVNCITTFFRFGYNFKITNFIFRALTQFLNETVIAESSQNLYFHCIISNLLMLLKSNKLICFM